MKPILISLSPYWYYLIGEGIKRIEVRKTIPKDQNWNKKVACYMTKDRKSFNRIPKEFQEKYKAHFGKVGMQFMCDSIESVNSNCSDYGIDLFYYDCLTQGCMKGYEVDKYFNIPIGEDLRVMKNNGYALHISDVKIYDKPKELGEFYKPLKYDEDGVICGTKQDMSNIYEWDCETVFNKKHTECTLKDCPQLQKFYRLNRPPQSWYYIEEL